MNKIIRILTISAFLHAPFLVQIQAHESQENLPGHGQVSSPAKNPGRVLQLRDGSRAIFLVQPDRKVHIRFESADSKPQAAMGREAQIIANPPSGKKTLKFELKDEKWVSSEALPEGNKYLVVLQLKNPNEAKPENHRIQLDLEPCGSCKIPEYACTCH
jgi:hypothetical protein